MWINQNLRCNYEKMICIVFSVCFLIQLSTAYAQSNQELEYPSNQNKSFVNEDLFYEQLDKKVYKEYKNATYSVRKKSYLKKYKMQNLPSDKKQLSAVEVEWCFKIRLFILIAKFIFLDPFLKMK